MKDSKLQFDRKNHVLYSKHGSFSQKNRLFGRFWFFGVEFALFFDLKKSDVA